MDTISPNQTPASATVRATRNRENRDEAVSFLREARFFMNPLRMDGSLRPEHDYASAGSDGTLNDFGPSLARRSLAVPKNGPSFPLKGNG